MTINKSWIDSKYERLYFTIHHFCTRICFVFVFSRSPARQCITEISNLWREGGGCISKFLTYRHTVKSWVHSDIIFCNLRNLKFKFWHYFSNLNCESLFKSRYNSDLKSSADMFLMADLDSWIHKDFKALCLNGSRRSLWIIFNFLTL